MKKRLSITVLVFLFTFLISLNVSYAASILKVGSRGSEVISLQQKLKDLGYLSGKVDGVFGTQTKNAVINYQKAKGLKADGIVGAQTWTSISGSKPPSEGTSPVPSNPTPPASGGQASPAPITRTLRSGSSGSDVVTLQNRLNALGYNCGKADGIFGSATTNAVKAFQRSQGISADGIAGSVTLGKLFASAQQPPAEEKPNLPDPPKQDPAPGNIGIGIITASSLNVRSGPGTSYGILGSVSNGQKLTILEDCNNGWYRVQYGSNTKAYVSKEYIKLEGASTPQQPQDPKDPGQVFNPVPGSLKGKTILLDPGHGGSNSGAAYSGIYEKNINLSVGIKLKSILEAAGAEVYLTRTSDTYYSLFYRSSYANKLILNREKEKVSQEKASLESEMKTKNSQKAGLEKQIIDLDKKLSEISSQIDQIPGEIKRKEDALKAETDKEQEPLKKMSDLQLQCKAEAGDLKEEIDKLSESEGFDILNKYAELVSLLLNDPQNSKRSELEDELRISDKKDISAELKEIKAKMTDAIVQDSDVKTRINGLFDSLISKLKQIASLESEIKAIDQNITKYQKDLDDLKTLKASLPKTAQDKEKAKNEAANQIASLVARVNEIEGILPGKDALITMYGARIARFQENLNRPADDSRLGIYGSSSNPGTQDLKETLELTRNAYQKDFLFISLHVNAAPSSPTTASGVTVYYRPSGYGSSVYSGFYDNYNSSARSKLASSILSRLNDEMVPAGFKLRATRPNTADFSVLRENNLVSCLVELGFMNNPADNQIIRREDTPVKAAKAIYLGIMDYFK